MKIVGTSVVPLLSMAQLLADPKKLIEYGTAAVTTGKQAQQASENHKASFAALGKVIAAMKRLFNKESQESSLVSTMTFAEFFEQKCGGKINNHANECSRTFGFFVENKLIEESDYDKNPANNLEHAARVLTAAKADITHSAIIKTADLLKDRPKDAVKQMVALIESIEGPKEIKHDRAKEMLAALFAAGHLELALAMAGAEIRTMKEADKIDRAADHLVLGLDGCGEIGRHKVLATLKPAETVKAVAAKLPKVTDEGELQAAFASLTAALDVCGTPDQQEAWMKAAA